MARPSVAYRIVMLGCGRVTGYWCSGPTQWTTDESRALRFPGKIEARHEAAKLRRRFAVRIKIEEIRQ